MGTQLSLRFQIGGHAPHQFRGHVVWEQRGDAEPQRCGMGVAFAPGGTARLARELEA